MPDGRRNTPRGRTPRNPDGAKGSLANESRLIALGDAVDRRNGGSGKRRRRGRRRTRRIVAWTALGLVAVLVAGVAGLYYYGDLTFGSIKKDTVKPVVPYVSGTPFNILVIGSDSRAGLKGLLANQAGKDQVFGQRSDVIKIVHVDPATQAISIVSIPRDTMVSLLANQSLYTNYNRINVNYSGGPSLLVRTIVANFGIPINHVVQVSFAGLINAADALGGVWLKFPYPAKDQYSGLHIHHAGCQLIKGLRTLEVVRSRHYEWYQDGQWYYDGTSDFGRIERQDTFIRALIDAARGQYNPVALNGFIKKLSSGIILDSTWKYNELLGLAYDFRHYHSSNLHTYTLPTVSPGYVAPYGDVLTVQEPEAQKLLVKIFGSELKTPSNPPPNAQLQPQVIPDIPVSTTSSSTTTVHHTSTSSHTKSKKKKKTPTTTTTLVPSGYSYFNPVPCHV